MMSSHVSFSSSGGMRFLSLAAKLHPCLQLSALNLLPPLILTKNRCLLSLTLKMDNPHLASLICFYFKPSMLPIFLVCNHHAGRQASTTATDARPDLMHGMPEAETEGMVMELFVLSEDGVLTGVL